MGRRRRFIEPFELRLDSLGPKGCGRGEHDGRSVLVRGGPPGAVVLVRPFKRKKGVLHARRISLVEPPPEATEPRCGQFGLCGGCTLQELPLEVQCRERAAYVEEVLAPLDGVAWHPTRSSGEAYGYRNKLELTYCASRYLSEEAHAEGAAIDGVFLGFHAPGRFDRVVETPRCELAPEGLNRLLAVAQEHLEKSAFAPWNPREHSGFWRHLVLRESTLGQRLVAIYTSPPEDEPAARAELESLAEAFPDVSGVCWYVNDRVADAAVGTSQGVLRGEPWIEEALGDLRFRLHVESFFQTNTAGARVLYDTVAEAAGEGTRLLDLYCGTGSIGLYLASRFREVVGVEIVEAAVEDARENAARNHIEHARFLAGSVEVLAEGMEADVVVVDPPRAGLHPKAVRWLAGLESARVLVYVACNPASLARDRAVLEEGGWRLTDVWTVDMFPQTGHMEAIGRFVRD